MKLKQVLALRSGLLRMRENIPSMGLDMETEQTIVSSIRTALAELDMIFLQLEENKRHDTY